MCEPAPLRAGHTHLSCEQDAVNPAVQYFSIWFIYKILSFFSKITNTLYLPALCNGFAQSSPDPSLLGSPRRYSWHLPPVKCPHSKQLAMGAPKHARSRPRLCMSIHTQSRGSPPPPPPPLLRIWGPLLAVLAPPFL
ncbi:hypothetical protein AB205_0002820 [Aquarana catesbeiana]|uniref:Uncharacterized protein n=1 Tax=Aquarana catesbeiana TaxID=8400 RepID=A0A2G9S1U2_AQUCT|nr:hypothetical protein AB205_0002820 [Aquarana catesbeiana]